MVGDIREIDKLSIDTPIAGTVIDYEAMEIVKFTFIDYHEGPAASLAKLERLVD